MSASAIQLAKGAFYRPTLLEATDPSLPIVQQEVFGPVLVIPVQAHHHALGRRGAVRPGC